MRDEAYDILKANNIIVTSQRKAIIGVFYDQRHNHLSARKIYKLIRNRQEQKMKIGIATVYRTLEMLEKKGIIVKMIMENSPALYELRTTSKIDHHHLICIECGKVTEIDDEFFAVLKRRIKEYNNFLVADRSMKIYGYCKACWQSTE